MGKSISLTIIGQEAITGQLKPLVWTKRVRAVMDAIIQDTASRLAEASPVGVFGHLQGAWLQTVGTEVTQTTVVGFSDPTPTAPYAWTVINGRAPGRMPPPIALLPWVWKKLGITGWAARAVAWNLARHIGKHGTKGYDFVTPIVKEMTPKYEKMLQGAFLVGP